jgi:hypothetical protein
MQCKVTRQYARDKEILLAEFNELNHAKQFIQIKLSTDAQFNVAAIYRLFDSGKLVEEVNRGKINVAGIPPQYFIKDEIQYESLEHELQVFAQYLNKSPSKCAEFADIKDARLYIEKCLVEDLTGHQKTVYRILKAQQFIEKFEPLKSTAQEKPVDTSTPTGAGNKTTFHPTPFNVSKPANNIPAWVKAKLKEKTEEKEGE